MSDHDHNQEGRGVSRRRVLECMTWAGTGVLWTISGGVPRSLGLVGGPAPACSGPFRAACPVRWGWSVPHKRRRRPA